MEARFYNQLSTELLKGAISVLDSVNAIFDIVTVPGVLEIPAAVSMAVNAKHNKDIQYDGFIVLGVVIKGQTSHFDIITRESIRGLITLSVSKCLAVGNGIVMVDNEEQAWARVSCLQLDKGGFAARAALKMIELKKQLCQ
ncbi:6,7-dimethyl-8-ribityllumazine synthase [Liberibacter crescens]|nr:6,7-dimethyl-8-ribityllumazine synthase [Liberibacter crescens]